MEKKQQGRSGIAFFLIAVMLIFTTILATVLLANNQRNLKQLLAAMGFEIAPPEAPKRPEPVRTTPKKPEPPRAILPGHAFADLQAPEQQFVRQIRSDPRALCDGLKDAGFRELEWKSAESGRWECSSLVPLARPGEENSSSIFIFVKGSGEEEITSFRVKLNIERPEDRQAVTTAAARAASVFLDHVRWADAASVTLQMQALKEFDLKRFGSRIQFKRESDEVTPRYNFLANQPPRARPKSIAELYFDRSKWLAYGDASQRSFVKGPTEWNVPAEVPDGTEPATDTSAGEKPAANRTP